MKSRYNPLRQPSVLAAACACLTTAHAADLTWNNSASTGNWNTTDANWTGSTWSNGTPDNAIFNNGNSTVTLTEAITGGSLTANFGGAPSGAHVLTLSGSSMSLGSIFVWGGYNGNLGNGGVDSMAQAYDQRMAINNMSVNVSGNATVRRGMLYVYNGANLNVSGAINSIDAWNVFREDNSTVTATGGIDFSPIASQVELYGGTVSTPFIKVGNATWDGGSGLTMGYGVNLVATQANNDFIQVYNNGDTGSRAAATITNGGMTLDTSSYAVKVATQLNGSGSLTKTGSGTLTLSTNNGYTGGTTVNGGVLEVQGSNSGNSYIRGTVTVNSGAELRYTGGDGTGFGFANKLDTININGGLVNSQETTHLWSATVNMTGGELRVNNGVNNPGGTVIQWNNSIVNTLASASTATISGSVNLRGDGGYNNAVFNVADGTAATDLLVSAAVTESNGSVGITKNGAGTMVLTGANNYTGATVVSGGKLLVNGNISTSVTTVQSGGTLGGSGTVGSVIVQAGGTLAPGNSPGTLAVDGDYSQAGTLSVEINGLTAGLLHDQVVVDRTSGDGTVSISGNLSLLFGGGYAPANGDLIFILLNDGTDAISGTFSGIAQDDIVASYGGYDWKISYSADASGSSFLGGNDIALVAVPEPRAALLGGFGLMALLRRRRIG